MHTRAHASRFSLPVPSTLARFDATSSPDVHECPRENADIFREADSITPHTDGWLAAIRRSSHRSVSDSLASAGTRASSSALDPDLVDSCAGSSGQCVAGGYGAALQSVPPMQVQRLPLRSSSSPLRSSQRAMRGGLLQSPRRGQACTPDRYIACRRPPAATRESFELNKPEQRREANQVDRGGRFNADPFSRRVRRSGRLNDELHGLREAYSLLIRRASAHRRNSSLLQRRNSLTNGVRQVSAGAVWNVGGPSAVSDTVAAVSTGRGSMLGTGTNAPLYTSTFLSRADPEAELEAYERRLALALEVDQTDRILQHSSLAAAVRNPIHGDVTTNAGHIWRDGTWIKDGVTSRLSICSLRIHTLHPAN
jgi:hypothetical protein